MTRLRNTKALLIISGIVCIATCVVTFNTYRAKLEAQFWVNHTHEVIEKAAKVLRYYKNAEIIYFFFQSSTDSLLQKKLNDDIQNFRVSIRELKELTIDNTGQTELINNKLAPVVERRLATIIDATEMSTGSTMTGQTLSHELISIVTVEGVIDQLITRERVLLKTRYDNLLRVTSFMIGWIYTSLVVILSSISLAFFTITKVHNKNQGLVDSLRNLNDTLEKKVARQTTDMQVTNDNLHNTNIELATINAELLASEEALKSNLEYISDLKNDLEVSEKQYRFLADSSQDMITIVGLDSVIEYTSPACKKLVGYDPAELLGKKGYELVYHEDLLRIQEMMAAVNAEGNSLANFRFRMVRKDGSLVWVEGQTNPIVDEKGAVVKRQTTVHDISQAKKAEEEILIAKAKAEEATVAKSQFLSTMSHEIRTPMNAVIGLTHILIQNEPRPDQLESLNLLKFSSENLLALINDILDFSKIEADRLVLEKVSFNLLQLLKNSKSIQQKKADEKGIVLQLKLGTDVPTYVIGDPVRLNQVITNLISNAIKFTEKGYVEICVNGKAMHNNTFRLEFKVKDSGIGIDISKLNLIFESFSQASSDTTRKFGGTGLGLAISKRLVELMGGNIRVDSMPNEGSTFAFEIDMKEGKEDETRQPTKLPVELTDVNAKILIVEDNRVNQIVASNFLKRWKIKADFADNGREALKMVQNKSYQLVLMDLQMPEMDGYATSKEIRALPDKYFKTIPIVALTASTMVEIQQKVFDSGMNDCISKPFDPENLRAKVFSFLNLASESVSFDRPWTEAFNLYTEGNPDLKREMAELLIKNIGDLQNTLSIAARDWNALEQCKATIHRVKTAITLLGDKEFEQIIEAMTAAIEHDDRLIFDDYYKGFINISQKLVEGLREQLSL